VLEIPIATKVIPLAIAGLIALSPLPKPDALFEMAKTTKIHKEHVTTDNGYTETITITERDSNEKKGIVSKAGSEIWQVGKGVCKKVYWWIKK
jgi:hypothetical protein